jgi:sigma-B regulation protein RsbQ
MDVLRRNNVKLVGSGNQMIMFAHGYGCDQNMWRHVVPSFSDKYTAILFDYVGSGSSESSAFDQARYSTLRGYALDILEILAALKVDQPVHFVGHSVSSMIGAIASIEEPNRFKSLTMIGPSPHYINEGDYFGGFERTDIDGLLESLESNHVAWSAAMAPVIMNNQERPELAQELEASFCRMDPFLAQHFARVTFLSDNRKDLALVDTRTLILQCQSDAIAGLRVGQYVHNSLKNSELVIMDAKGHCPHMSDPNAVIREIHRFLQ